MLCCRHRHIEHASAVAILQEKSAAMKERAGEAVDNVKGNMSAGATAVKEKGKEVANAAADKMEQAADKMRS